MLRMGFAFVCLILVACSGPEPAKPALTQTVPVAAQIPEPEPTRTIDTLIDSVPAAERDPLLQAAVERVAGEYRADWMLTDSAGSVSMWQHAATIYQSGKQGLTFYSLIKEAFQITREDFLNRAEVAKTTADMLARAEVEAARNREIRRLLREQQLLVERQRAAQQAAFDAELQAQAQAQAAYSSVSYGTQRAQETYREQQRPMPVNPSRFDPENVGFDSRRGYTSPRYSSRDRSSDGAARVQTGPRRFQDQNGNWYEQPSGSGFARDERTGQQCFVNGAFVHCR